MDAYRKLTHPGGDNFQFRLVGDHKDQFAMGMMLAFSGRRATHYAISPHWGMIFLSSSEDQVGKEREYTTHFEGEYSYHSKGPKQDGRTINLFECIIPSYLTEIYQVKGFGSKLTAATCAERAWKWLKTAEYIIPELSDVELSCPSVVHNPHDYFSDPDVDNDKGFEISTGDVWNHVGAHYNAICHVRPHWIWLGK